MFRKLYTAWPSLSDKNRPQHHFVYFMTASDIARLKKWICHPLQIKFPGLKTVDCRPQGSFCPGFDAFLAVNSAHTIRHCQPSLPSHPFQNEYCQFQHPLSSGRKYRSQFDKVNTIRLPKLLKSPATENWSKDTLIILFPCHNEFNLQDLNSWLTNTTKWSQ